MPTLPRSNAKRAAALAKERHALRQALKRQQAQGQHDSAMGTLKRIRTLTTEISQLGY